VTLAALAALYAVVGLGCAIARLAWRAAPTDRVLDAVLLWFLWPLYGPFLLLRLGAEAPAASETAFIGALRRAGRTPLAAVLPDEATVRVLARRLRIAAGKVEEIEALLERPEFREEDAVRHIRDLRERGASETALSSAGMRLQNIRRLRALKDRFARELDEVAELLKQLTTQAEVVRLAGGPDASTTELVRELLSRVEGLDEMLEDEPPPHADP
jgi:hypothetical protein